MGSGSLFSNLARGQRVEPRQLRPRAERVGRVVVMVVRARRVVEVLEGCMIGRWRRG